jgi:hypothetical protein
LFTSEESISLPNCSTVSLIKPKNKRINKVSGGLTVLVRSEIKQGIKLLEHTNNDYIWLKLCKKNVGVTYDIYLCYMYNPPANSTYTQSLQEDIFDLIENDLAKYSEKGHILIMGDLNARTSDDNDFIPNDSNDNTVQQYDDYTPDVEIINRFSRDTVLLSRGRALHDMCIQTGLRILNGRCIGDLTGNFTYHNFHGSSVVDYACVSECLLPKVKFFSVHKFLPDLSDHCQISLMMKINCTLTPDDNQMYPLPVRYK